MKPTRPEDCDTVELRGQLAGGCTLRDAVSGPRERRLPRQRTLGVLRVGEHCEFTWHQDEGDTRRIVRVDGSHCRDCVQKLEAMLGIDLVLDRRRDGATPGL